MQDRLTSLQAWSQRSKRRFGVVPDVYRNGHRYFQATAWRSPSVLEFGIKAYDVVRNREYNGQFLYRLDGTVQRR